MTSITVQISKTQQDLPAGKTFNHTRVTVTDNSGATLEPVLLSGSESPPWSATFTGTTGPNPASALVEDLDQDGNVLGTALTLTETGTGGETQQFAASTGGTISVVS